MEQKREQRRSSTATTRGWWSFCFRRFPLFHRGVKVHDCSTEDEQLRQLQKEKGKKERSDKTITEPKKMEDIKKKEKMQKKVEKQKSTKKEGMTESGKPACEETSRWEKEITNCEERMRQLDMEIQGFTKREEKLKRKIEQLKKRIEGSDTGSEDEEENVVPPHLLVPLGDPAGVLTVTIKHCRDFEKFSRFKRGPQSAVMVTFGSVVWRSSVQPYKDHINIEEKTHFSVQISDRDLLGDIDSSFLKVELVLIDGESGAFKVIGKTTIQLVDILNKPAVSHKLDLMHKYQKVCTVDADLVFTYGFLGYGYSHQIRHPGRTMESLVEKSCFLRPAKDQTSSHSNEETPSTLPTVSVSSLTQDNRKRGNLDKTSASSRVSNLIQKRGRLTQLHDDWKECGTEKAKLRYLEKLIFKQDTQKPTEMPKGPAEKRRGNTRTDGKTEKR